MLPGGPSCDFSDAILDSRGLTAPGGGQYPKEEQMRTTWNYKHGNIIETMLRDGRIQVEDLSFDQLPPSYKTAENVFRTHEVRQKSLAGLTIKGIDFSNCDFSDFSLGYFENCNFDNANFTDAVIITGRLNGSSPYYDTIYKQSFIGMFGFKACNITEEQMRQTRFWKRGDLNGLALEGMKLDGWDFSNKHLRHVSFEGSSLRNANFENATLYLVDLTVQNMTNTGLIAEELEQERQRPQWTPRTYTFTSTFTIDQLKRTKSWKERTIQGCTFSEVNFDDSDLRRFDFTGTRFFQCSFTNADVTGARRFFPANANVQRNHGVTEQQLRSTEKFDERTLWIYLE